jgi:hypothetical protein
VVEESVVLMVVFNVESVLASVGSLSRSPYKSESLVSDDDDDVEEKQLMQREKRGRENRENQQQLRS